MERPAKKPIGYQKHITYELREKIEAGLKSGLNKAQIAKTIHKDPTTVAKEIRNHRTPSGSPSKAPFDCANYKKCTRGRECRTSHDVFMECTDYDLFKCKRRDRSPGVCNGCTKAPSCRFSKYYYRADVAQRAYEYMLRDARTGFNLTYSEAQWMADIIKPELEQGKSPYAILNEHPELKISEKCLYNYIELGAFEQFGINSLALRNQVKRRKMPKVRANQYRKRKDSSYLTGRTFKDFLEYNPLVAAQYSINHSVKLYGGRSLYENTAFMMPEIYEALKFKGYSQIDKDKVELKSSVLKKK